MTLPNWPVEFTLTGEGYTIISDAARRAEMARRAYAPQAVLAAAANGATVSGQDPLELVLIELMRAAGLVRRIAASLNQAVTKLNAPGRLPGGMPLTQANTGQGARDRGQAQRRRPGSAASGVPGQRGRPPSK